jgi:hypothetical protein
MCNIKIYKLASDKLLSLFNERASNTSLSLFNEQVKFTCNYITRLVEDSYSQLIIALNICRPVTGYLLGIENYANKEISEAHSLIRFQRELLEKMEKNNEYYRSVPVNSLSECLFIRQQLARNLELQLQCKEIIEEAAKSEKKAKKQIEFVKIM